MQSTTWDRRLYFPSEGRRAEDFFAKKIRRLRPGLNQRPVRLPLDHRSRRKFHSQWKIQKNPSGIEPRLPVATAYPATNRTHVLIFLIFRWLQRAVVWEGMMFLCTPQGLVGERRYTSALAGDDWSVSRPTVLSTGPRAVLTLWSRQKSYHGRDWSHTILELSRPYPNRYTNWAVVLW